MAAASAKRETVLWLPCQPGKNKRQWSRSVVSDSLRPMDCSLPGSSVYGIFPGNSPEVDCHFLLQGIFPTQGLNPGLPHYRQTLYHRNLETTLLSLRSLEPYSLGGILEIQDPRTLNDQILEYQKSRSIKSQSHPILGFIRTSKFQNLRCLALKNHRNIKFQVNGCTES